MYEYLPKINSNNSSLIQRYQGQMRKSLRMDLVDVWQTVRYPNSIPYLLLLSCINKFKHTFYFYEYNLFLVYFLKIEYNFWIGKYFYSHRDYSACVFVCVFRQYADHSDAIPRRVDSGGLLRLCAEHSRTCSGVTVTHLLFVLFMDLLFPSMLSTQQIMMSSTFAKYDKRLAVLNKC